MKALVLAAGFGTRLRPWTDELAKPLIPVAGVEALFYALYRVRSLGVKEVFVNAHYKADQIGAALESFKESFPELSLKLSYEKEILGTGGAILKLLEEEDFSSGLLVLNGDTLASFDARPISGNSRSTFAVSFNAKFFEKYKPVWLHADGFWSREPAEKAAHFLGTHFLHGEDLKYLRAKKLPVVETDLFQGIYEVLAQNGRSPRGQEFLTRASEFWFDLNSKEFLLEARDQLAGPYFSQWKSVLALRHPGKSPEAALKFWPLQASSDKS